MSRFGAGIRRGVMAADQFTQIANALFRDAGLSFKAKGIFGSVSTHRNGWQVTVTDLVRLGPDGREAVRTGLQELEAHGYLIRERLRRPDGTLGEVVYCITDRPATWDIALIEADLLVTGSEAEHADGLPAGIRRGVMAADQFTQIANALFRDTQLSFKAKGLFGLLSTHRDGWRMTVSDIARRGRDGDSAVKSGLKELEKHGFLVRERERGPDGTLGAVAYFITDLPALQNGRSGPESGFPPVDDPTLAHRPTKNTNRKNTTQQHTSPLRPCRGDASRAPGRTDRPDTPSSPPAAPAADEMHPGIRLLLELGAARPELLLTGQALTDQGRVVTVMLESGWSREQLRHVIAARPLPHPVRTTVGAIIAARLRAAQAYPPPTLAADQHDAPVWDDPSAPPMTGSAAARTVSEALTYRALVECAGCGFPGIAPGEDLCPACLGWPLCRTCPGPTPRRAHPDGDGRCTTCASAFAVQPEGSP
ncbi:helix-turn-helix domain-containing protein [Streptomyces cylindrosporus]|uniref:Helix-turn-helix domain-containing protein n=1 Tax=Streptomyces cylindrosporus TaxID=2927583 RepID=A0ABS9Y801_9ACTN|nr:helix-turn-helix domain-containing protein [Streptomyces cylindrosporus]MCI3273348.1 helix-turn-helix domain-containing protein [Streptomyces cylindrosporus]